MVKGKVDQELGSIRPTPTMSPRNPPEEENGGDPLIQVVTKQPEEAADLALAAFAADVSADADDDAAFAIVKTEREDDANAAPTNLRPPGDDEDHDESSDGDDDGFHTENRATTQGEGEEENDGEDDHDEHETEGAWEEEDEEEEDGAYLTNLSDLALIAGAANGSTKPKPKPKPKPKKEGGQGGEKPPKRKPLRSASEITQEELSSCFHLPSEAACRKLGIGLTVLKRQCRKFGIKRWPFRKMKSLDRLITNVQAGISPGDQNRTLVKSVEELEEQKRRMEECQVLDLDDNTKRLQQAYSKANHKARRMAQAPELGGLGGLLALSDKRGSDVSTAGVAGGDGDHVREHVNNTMDIALKQANVSAVLGAMPVLGDTAATITAAANAIQAGGNAADLLPSTFTGLNQTQQNILAQLASAMDAKEPGDRSSISAFTTALTNLAAQGQIAVQPEAVEAWRSAAHNGLVPFAQPRPSDAATNPFAPALDPADLVDGKNPVTAVTGAWSPARPARKFDADGNEVDHDGGAEVLGELLAQRTKRGRPAVKREVESESESESESSESEEEPEPEEEAEGDAGRSGRRRKPNPKYQPEKTPKKKKKKSKKDKKKRKKKRARKGGEGGDDDDADPLASLAAAALGAAKTTKPAGKASAVPAEHPAFAVQQKSRTTVARAAAAPQAPRIDKSTITLLVTEHADRLRDMMLTLANQPREGENMPATQEEKQAISDAIGVEALKLRDALNELVLPQGGGRP